MQVTLTGQTNKGKSPAPVIVIGDCVWLLAEHGQARESHWVLGREVKVYIDTATYCYKMTCPCGRTRYAKANSLYEITQCRICTRKNKLKRKNQAQRVQRRQTK